MQGDLPWIIALVGAVVGFVGWTLMEHTEEDGAPAVAGTAFWFVGIGTVVAMFIILMMPSIIGGLEVIDLYRERVSFG